jgi:hypothetical protein
MLCSCGLWFRVVWYVSVSPEGDSRILSDFLVVN